MLESVYEATLAYELNRRGLKALTQQKVPVVYEDVQLELGFRPDIIIDSKVIVEVKSIEAIAPVHRKQLETYLRLTGDASWAADQFQCGACQEWNSKSC